MLVVGTSPAPDISAHLCAGECHFSLIAATAQDYLIGADISLVCFMLTSTGSVVFIFFTSMTLDKALALN